MNLSPYPAERRTVDNRVFVIGLDLLYRSSMKKFESTHLVDCARTVARALGATPATGPVEGYYAESTVLTEYFQLMRALQEVDEDQAWRVKDLPAFSKLHAIATSGCYGAPEPGHLLPRGKDALGHALEAVPVEAWSVDRLLERARLIAVATGDFSLVSLAIRTGDPVLVAATRESVVLYQFFSLGGEIDPIEYVWHVDPELAAAANQFIDAFNQLGGRPLPPAVAASAEAYYEAATHTDLAGRCVAIGRNPVTLQYYHWAIAGESFGNLRVEDFWEPDLWTTARYQSGQIIQ